MPLDKSTSKLRGTSMVPSHVPVRLRDNTKYFRERIGGLGMTVLEGLTPICPVMVGDEALANTFQQKLFERGVFVSGFTYPVVPRGQARLRCQISAAHSTDQLDQAVEAFATVGKELGLI